jgi:histidinol-phosphate phosphatase family protein
VALTAAVFLDKDGTLIVNVPYNVDPRRIQLTARAAEGVQLLARSGYRLIVVSNQPGVALGLFPERAMRVVESRLRELLRHAGVARDGFYYCPHLPQAETAPSGNPCDCRKPASGLLLRAAREHGLDLARCWMIGDILDDIEAGRGAGCRTVLIDNGNETQWRLHAARRPHETAADLHEAAALIARLDHRDHSAAAACRP